jgi:hypothetical protein
MKTTSLLFLAAISLVGANSAQAMEPICWKAALMAGAAFKEASSLGYEQQDVDTFQVSILSNMSLTRTDLKKLGTDKFLETYLIQEENTGTDNIATVVIEAHNKANGICVIKSISEPKQ